MASGCIMGDCPVCDELVWEDNWDLVDGEDLIFVHTECKSKANGLLLRIKRLEEKIKISEKQVWKEANNGTNVQLMEG